jgi:hypothetical protein
MIMPNIEQTKYKQDPQLANPIKQTPPEQPQQAPQPSGVPRGVKFIAILHYLGALIMFLAFLSGLAILFGFLDSSTLAVPDVTNSILYTSLGIALVFLVLHIFLGRGLWKGRQWARILTIILAVLGLAGSVYGIIQGLDNITNIISNSVGIILSLLIAIYLLFSKKVKTAFSSKQTSNPIVPGTPSTPAIPRTSKAQFDPSKIPYHAPKPIIKQKISPQKTSQKIGHLELS